MEKPITVTNSPEANLVNKFRLTSGTKVSFEKIGMSSSSKVPIGTVQEGTLNVDVKVGNPITFLDSPASISEVMKVEEQNGQLFIHTVTSTYVLRPERQLNKTEDFVLDDVEMVETGKGSTYRYLSDGTTQRFKKVEGREYEPQDALVYVPPFEWIKKHASPKMLDKIGDDESMYEQRLQDYIFNPLQDGRKLYIVDANGKVITTNEEIRNTQGQIYLAFVKENQTDFTIPVSHKPVVGYYTFDTRKYEDKQTGEHMRDKHLGNKVVKITLKNKKTGI